MENLREECFGKANHCWCKVMNQWLENDGTPEYPATWRGVLTVLVDFEVARELQRVLASVTPPSLPPPPPPPQMAQPAVTSSIVTPPLDPGKTPLAVLAVAPLPEPARTPLFMAPPPVPDVCVTTELAVTTHLEPDKTLFPESAETPLPEPARNPPSFHHSAPFA